MTRFRFDLPATVSRRVTVAHEEGGHINEDWSNGAMETLKLSVSGMSCQGCADGLARRLGAEPGVELVEVSFERKSAKVDIDPARIDQLRLIEIVTDAGFTAE